MKAAMHVILEALPPALGREANQQSVEAATKLFSLCCCQNLARIAVKVVRHAL